MLDAGFLPIDLNFSDKLVIILKHVTKVDLLIGL